MIGKNRCSLSLEEIEELRTIKSQNSKVEKKSISQSHDTFTSKKKSKPSDTESDNKSKKPGIVINRMYVGGYLASNLGHEIINLFQADNGLHYLYLNSSGSFAAEHHDVDYMLMVKYAGHDCFEIVGLAKGLDVAPGADKPRSRDIMQFDSQISNEQRDYINAQPQNGVRYGGVSILDIFDDAEQQSVFITYRADEVLVPKGDMRIFLKYSPDAENKFGGKETILAVRQHNLPKTSLKSYIYPKSGNRAAAGATDYDNIIENLIDNQSLWTADRTWKVTADDSGEENEISLFDICRIQDDENRFSNALAYFMSKPEYRKLWLDFFKEYDVELNGNYKVDREADARIKDPKGEFIERPGGGRIDLLLVDGENIVVIENKIKSDVNLTEKDKDGITQLDRYLNYVDWRMSGDSKVKHGSLFILCPDYNVPDLSHGSEEVRSRYKIITYGKLYNYLKKFPEVDEDANFRALRNAMQRHTYATVNGYLYNEMLEKFERRITGLQINKI